ncbi:unnamed protein product [Microthlaspi erraticum]|uniref:EngC GTPase domain-containing protein n=1 Tax=Microthlaspi erraticum TaxID=1685480 RepID=A0A6D2KV99_9BRAS|nr:unnamed protein product [Microthlaspi erraticum]
MTFSTSIIRHFSSAALASFLRRTSISHGGCGFGGGVGTRRSFCFLSAERENSNVSRAFRAPVLSSDKKNPLFKSEAIGTVVITQANYMRVIVQPEAVNGDERSSSKTGFEILCQVRTILRKLGKRVMVGDRVLVEDIDWVDQRGMIVTLFDHRSENVDPPVANVDHLLVFFSFDKPKLKPDTLSRFLVQAESSGLPLTLALNKCELVTQEEMESWKIRLRGWNYEPLFCSVVTEVGLDEIELNLRNKTTVIIGPSGVGKSSLINILRSSNYCGAMEYENWFEPRLGKTWFEDQRVNGVSSRCGRGTHTTRNVTLLRLSEGGFVADTPGFNQPKFLKVTKQSLALCFPEIQRMFEEGKCGFKDCLHIGEPGCVVKGDWERYPYYLQLLDEIRVREEFQLGTFGRKTENVVRYKVGRMGVKQAEPRLEPKKHRRQSRKKMKQTMISELDDFGDEEDSDLDLEE